MEVKPGDVGVVKQEKTSVQPPWNPKPWNVMKVYGTKLYLEREGKCKVLKAPEKGGSQQTELPPRYKEQP